jgi:hypothetical protein
VATEGTGTYSPTVPFDRTLRIPLQTPRMTLKQSGVVATIALVTATLGAAGIGAGAGAGDGAGDGAAAPPDASEGDPTAGRDTGLHTTH